MVFANVTNIVVKCSKDSYTIGGTVSGLLHNQSLTLSNNGDDLMQISENGSFTFKNPVAAGSGYNVAM